MINYNVKQNLQIPIKLFFQTIKRVRNYKNFVPWCKDSWEVNKEVFHNYCLKMVLEAAPNQYGLICFESMPIPIKLNSR